MSCLSFRIGCSTTTFSDDWFMTVLYHVARKGCVYAVKEVSQKSGHHIHVLVETDISKKSFSQFMKNKFPVLNKGNWSVKNEPQQGDDLEKAKCYLSKGLKPTPVESAESDPTTGNLLWTTQKHLPTVFMNTLGVDVDHYYDMYWNCFFEREKQVVVIPKQVMTFTQRVALELEMQQNEWTLDRDNQEFVYKYVMKSLGEKGKVFDFTVVKRILNGVWNILAHDEFVHKFAHRHFEDFVI